MVIEEIDEEPGQENLSPGDCISAIAGKSLQELLGHKKSGLAEACCIYIYICMSNRQYSRIRD